jgi:hypothetical protein
MPALFSMSAQSSSLDSPAGSAFAITPNDGADLATVTRSIYIGSSGNVSVILAGDSSAVTFSNMAVGYHPLRVKRLRSTGTTAGSIVGLA